MFELVYTAAPRGLIAGRSGFSTVAMTAGFPPNLISPVENMSGYRHFFPPGHPDAERNPVNYACQHYRWGSTLFIVLSKVSCAGLSYTGRTNVLAHHLLFTPSELSAIPGGATAVLRCPENFPPWTGDPRELPRKNPKRIGRADAASQELWAELAGDRNWAACIADRFRTDPKNSWVCTFDPVKISGEMLLDLIDSVTHHLSPEEAMNFTFCTYCTTVSGNNSFALRAYPEGSSQPINAEHPTSGNFIRLGRHNPLPAGWQPPAPRELPKKTAPPGKPVRLTVIEPPPEQPAPPAEPVHFTVIESPEQPEAPNRSAPAPVRVSPPPRPSRINVCAPGGTDFPPGLRQQEPPESPEKRFSLPGIIFAAAALLLGALLLVFLFAPSRPEKETPPATPAATPPSGGMPPRRDPPRKAEPRKTAPPSAASPALPRKTEPRGTAQLPAARKKPGPENPEDVLRQRFLFHREFNLGRKAPLPAAFRDASALTVELSGIGASDEIDDLKSYVSGSGRKVTVRPFTETKNELLPVKSRDDSSPHVMTLELKGGCLVVKVPPEARNTPRIGNIGKITITGPGGKRFDFLPGAPDRKFIGFIRNNPGKLTVKQAKEGEAVYNCVLEISDDLRAFRRHLVLRINGRPISGDIDSGPVEAPGPDFSEAQALLGRWNKAVKNFSAALQELSRRSPEESAWENDLEKLMAEVPEEGKARKEELKKAINKRKPSISLEIAALCAQLPPPQEDKKKGKSVSPQKIPLKTRLEELGKRWNSLRERKARLRRQYTDVFRKVKSETVTQLQALPRELFRECLECVKAGKCVGSDFYTRFRQERLRNAVKIETDWREDHGSTSNDR